MGKEHFMPMVTSGNQRREPSVKGAQIVIDLDVPLDQEEIADRVSAVLGEVEAEYGLDGFWNADRSIYAFERSGIVGEAHVEDGHVSVDVKLGVVFGALRKTIERKLRERLEEGLQ
jgi:putative polyhydroxyalkanoate system protein